MVNRTSWHSLTPDRLISKPLLFERFTPDSQTKMQREASAGSFIDARTALGMQGAGGTIATPRCYWAWGSGKELRLVVVLSTLIGSTHAWCTAMMLPPPHWSCEFPAVAHPCLG